MKRKLNVIKGMKESWSEFCKKVIVATLEKGTVGVEEIASLIMTDPKTVRGWLTRDKPNRIKPQTCGLIIESLAPWQMKYISADDKVFLGIAPPPPAKTADELETEKAIARLKAQGYQVSLV